MNLRDYLSIVRDYWRSILGVTVAGVLLALGVVWVTGLQPAYIARTAVLLTPAQGSTALEVVGGAQYAPAQAASFAKIADMDVVLAPVVQQLHLPYSAQELGKLVTTWSDAALVDILVTDVGKESSAAIAQAIADQLVRTVGELTPVDSTGRPVLTATVVNQAGIAISAESGVSLKSAVALGLLGGLVLGLAQAALRKALSLSAVHSAEEA